MASVIESVGYFGSRFSGSSPKESFMVLHQAVCIDPIVLNPALVGFSFIGFPSGLFLDPLRLHVSLDFTHFLMKLSFSP